MANIRLGGDRVAQTRRDSIEACRRAMRISPRDSRLSVWQGLIGFNHFQLGRYAAAEQALRESVAANPRVPCTIGERLWQERWGN